MKRLTKRLLFGEGRRPCRIRLGLFRGLRLSVDPSCETSLLLGLYEAETTSALRKMGERARAVIDVGAGYGELTAWALKQRSVERVCAFDPKAERWSVFRENMELNGFAQDARLSAECDFFPGPSSAWVSSLPEPVLVKIDVDGGEMKLLQDLRGVLQRKKFDLLIETHSEELDLGCRTLLEECGYQVRIIPQAWWRRWIPERRPVGFNRWLCADHLR